MDAKKELLAEFGRMETEREAVLKNLQALTPEKLAEKPAPNEWSVAEVIMHLVIAETAALNYMRKKLEYGSHKKASFGAGIKQRLLNFLISLPIKFKAPKIIEFTDDQNVSFAEATEKWNQVRNELQKEYDKLDSETVTHELFKHPAMGKMNVIQSVRFMRQHMNRHIGQMHRTVEKIK